MRLPYTLIILADFENHIPPWLDEFISLIAHANSAFNPILYAKFNPAFISGYRKCLNKLSKGILFKEYNEVGRSTFVRINNSNSSSIAKTNKALQH